MADQEKRRFQRILFDAPVTLRYGNHTQETRLVDISLKGALTLIPDNWQGNDSSEIELQLVLGGDVESIDMRVSVAHQDSEHLGLSCRHIELDSISSLRRLVELNLGDPELLERELAALG